MAMTTPADRTGSLVLRVRLWAGDGMCDLELRGSRSTHTGKSSQTLDARFRFPDHHIRPVITCQRQRLHASARRFEEGRQRAGRGHMLIQARGRVVSVCLCVYVCL
jgi:hypothetical protein